MQEESLLPPLPDSEETGLPDLSDARFYTQYPDFFLSIYTGFVFAQIPKKLQNPAETAGFS